MKNDKYEQILKVLESNDTRCTDDKTDREELAIVLTKEFFSDFSTSNEGDNAKSH
jgi:hypothetical protein